MPTIKKTASKGKPIEMPPADDGLSEQKDHYFEVAMRSYSNGVLNQEVIIVREFAKTGAELTLKQMGYTKSAAVKIVQASIDAMDDLSGEYQKVGAAEIIAAMQGDGK